MKPVILTIIAIAISGMVPALTHAGEEASGQAPDQSPKPMLLEAESYGTDRTKTVPDAEALRHAYLTATRDGYETLVKIDVPEKMPEVAIWVRARGYKLCLKGTQPGGGAVEIKWNYRPSNEWQWTKFGSFSRDALGGSFLLMCAPGAPEYAGIDALVIAPPGGFDPAEVDNLESYRVDAVRKAGK